LPALPKSTPAGPGSEQTLTLTFTTENEMKLNSSGNIPGYGFPPWNDTYNGTYVYYSNIKEGWLNCNYWNTGKFVFALSEDSKKLVSTTSTTVFTKKN